MPHVMLNKRRVFVPNSLNEVEFRQLGAIDTQRNLVQRTKEGNYLVPRGTVIDMHEDDTFFDAPTRVKGSGGWKSMMGWIVDFGNDPPPVKRSGALVEPAVPTIIPPRPMDRRERIRKEVVMVAEYFSRYKGVRYDEENADWLIIPKYRLPEGWRDRWCSLLIVFPEGYPLTPPIGFYLNRRFKLADGTPDPHLTGNAHYGAPDLQGANWHWYCVRLEDAASGGWRPSADYRQPDNLWTFIRTVREVVSDD